MKSLLPWIIIVALLGGVYYFYSASKENELKLTKAAADIDEVDKLRQENEELKKAAPPTEDVASLRKDHEDLLRVRSEVQRLHDENKQLSAQLLTARAQSSQVLQTQQQLASENASLRNQSAKLSEAQTLVLQQTDACINNLRQIDGAKQSWALENKKTAADIPTAADLAPYLTNQIVCPSGGAYSINAVGVAPTCTSPGHSLAR